MWKWPRIGKSIVFWTLVNCFSFDLVFWWIVFSFDLVFFGCELCQKNGGHGGSEQFVCVGWRHGVVFCVCVVKLLREMAANRYNCCNSVLCLCYIGNGRQESRYVSVFFFSFHFLFPLISFCFVEFILLVPPFSFRDDRFFGFMGATTADEWFWVPWGNVRGWSWWIMCWIGVVQVGLLVLYTFGIDIFVLFLLVVIFCCYLDIVFRCYLDIVFCCYIFFCCCCYLYIVSLGIFCLFVDGYIFCWWLYILGFSPLPLLLSLLLLRLYFVIWVLSLLGFDVVVIYFGALSMLFIIFMTWVVRPLYVYRHVSG